MPAARLVTLILATLASSGALAAAPGPVVTPGLGASVDDHLSRLHALDAFNGVVLVARGDEVLLRKGYGLADHEKPLPFAPDTVSCLGSITKQFTAACIMRLVEQGKLSTDDTLSKWFEGLPEDKAPITIHQLLTHTAGMPDILGEDEEPIGRDELMTMAWAAALINKPGERNQYSNLGYSILGAIVEKASGRPYEEFLREELLKPAGLNETAYMLPESCIARLAAGYRNGERWGMVYKNGWREDGPGWHLRCNGGLQSTVSDMHTWVRALQTGRVLKPETVALMWRPLADEGGGESFYGYGWAISEPAPGWTIVGHNGGNGFQFADCKFATSVPEGSNGADLLYILMTNEARFAPVSEHIGRFLLGDPPAAPPALAPTADAEFARLEGRYDFGAEGAVTVSRAGAGVRLVGEGFRLTSTLGGLRSEQLPGAEEKAKRIETILTAATKGDFQPIADAYGGRVPLERLSAVYADRFRQLEPQIGAAKGVKIVGAGPGDGPRQMRTLFRWVGEKGEGDIIGALWEGDALVGFNATAFKQGVAAWPTGAGAFRAYDVRSGPGAEFRFETNDGASQLRLGSSDGALVGVKAR